MSPKPFLKWAGGKRWLADKLSASLPSYTGTYFEPFLGGGAVFFRSQPRASVLSDVNPRLIETYEVVRDEPEALLSRLDAHHKRHSRMYYYAVRDYCYAEKVDRAAQFVYLNRTCWNGLYRENLKGKFNVPMGTKTEVVAPDEDFRDVSAALKSADILVSDFEEIFDRAEEGDIIFADPPYTTAHNFNGFVKYNEKVFSWSDQVRLRDAARSAQSRGVKVIITNAFHESIIDLYQGLGQLQELRRQSVISGKSDGRSVTSECLIML